MAPLCWAVGENPWRSEGLWSVRRLQVPVRKLRTRRCFPRGLDSKLVLLQLFLEILLFKNFFFCQFSVFRVLVRLSVLIRRLFAHDMLYFTSRIFFFSYKRLFFKKHPLSKNINVFFQKSWKMIWTYRRERIVKKCFKQVRTRWNQQLLTLWNSTPAADCLVCDWLMSGPIRRVSQCDAGFCPAAAAVYILYSLTHMKSVDVFICSSSVKLIEKKNKLNVSF